MTAALKAHAHSAAAVSLVVFCACVACFIPPLNQRILGNPLLITLVALGIASSGILHLVFVGLLARSYSRSPAKYVALALVSLPLGSIVGLALLEWYEKTDGPVHKGAA